MKALHDLLANFAHEARPSISALDVLRLSFLDWIAVGLAGSDEPVSRIMRAQALDEGGAAQAGLIGSTVRVPARAAALVNGTISHALDYDDTHFAHIGHPSVAIIPAALATAQLAGATGQSLQEAALIGAEASIRIGLWLGRSHYQAGFHQTATAGAFGSCLASSSLLGLTRHETAMALGLVSTRASGLKSQFGTMGKPMNAGIAAANGVEAALLAARGFVSNVDALDGPQGFRPTHRGEGTESAWDAIGQDWYFEGVSHKLHACCHGLHAMLEALSPLVGMNADTIENIEIKTHPRWLAVCDVAAPKTGLEAKFSYRMTAAMCLQGHDTSLPSSFTDTLCSDPVITALRDKVTVKADDTLSEMQAEVTINCTDRRQRLLKHDLNAPASFSERAARIRDKAEALLGGNRAERLSQLIRDQASPDAIAAELAN